MDDSEACFRSTLYEEMPDKPHSSSTFLLETLHSTNPAEDELEDELSLCKKGMPEAVMLPFRGCSQDGALSPTSPTRVHRMELLKRGSPKSKALESLRVKIQQQKLMKISDRPVVELKYQGHVTRKVCRVASKGSRIVPGTAGVMGLCARKACLSPSAPTASNLKPDSKDAALRDKEHSAYISAWREAQKLVKEVLDHQIIWASEPQDNCKGHKKSDQQIAALNVQNRSKQRSGPQNVTGKSSHRPSGKNLISCIKSSPACKPFEQLSRNQNPSKDSSHCQDFTGPSGRCAKSSAAQPFSLKEKENEGPTKPSTTQRLNAQELHEYMHQRALERRQKEQQIKHKAEVKEEKKRQSMQEVLKKQKEVLQWNRKQPAPEPEKRKNDEKKSGHVLLETEQMTYSSKALGQSQCDEGNWQTDCFPEASCPVPLAGLYRSQISLAEVQKHRVDTLRKMMVSLDARVEKEAAQLVIMCQKGALTIMNTDKQLEAADRNNKRAQVSIDGSMPKKKEIKISVDQWACPDAEMCVLQSGQATIQHTSEQDDNSESTDSTSKWSELSEVYSQSQLQRHLSLAQSQQFLREEELRARQYSALFRLREKALWERTQAELEWLEHCKQVTSESDALAEIKQKQEEVVSSLRQQQAEIHHWRNAYKCGRQQRRLLLCHQRDILDIMRSATHFREVLQKQAMAETDTRPRAAAPVLEQKSFITKPGIIPAARSRDKSPGEQRRFLTKAGLRRLLTSDEVWSFGKKRSSGEQIQTEQENLQQTTGSKDSCDPKRFFAYGHRNQPCHHANAERKVKSEDGKPSHRREPQKADSILRGCEHETEKNTQSSSQKHPQRVTPPKSSDVYSGEKIQYPTEVTWKPSKNVQHFTSGQHNQTSCGITERAPIVSSLSSDIEEDLPYDYDDSHKKPREQRETKLQEVLKTYSASEDMTLDCGLAVTDNATFNVENNQRSQTVLLLNNNHETCSESKKSESNTAFTRIWQNTKDSIADKPLIANLVQALSSDLKRGEDSPSCDDSLSETEDKSEPFSLQSEAFAWSEEEKDVLNEDKTSTCSLVYAEKFTVIPEPSLYYYQSSNKHNELGSHDVSHYEREMTAECTLSEILSPVDEVLSYGSAELPPSVKAGGPLEPNSNSLPPPPPAFEIITWTSEEDLPAPLDFVEDISINSENFPNLPVDLSLSRKETNSLGECEVNNDIVIGDGCKTLSPAPATGQDAEDECSEYTSSLPVDESNEIEDPLSSFHIGDRVLVCNSRPGVLKYKGLTEFAGGFWAGVALDTPNGNHNGTFRGVKYFTCEKNHGVLVRAEDVTHLHREHYSDLKSGLDEDNFSDEDPSHGQDGKNGNKPSGNGQGRHKDSQSSSGHDPSAPKQTCQQEQCETEAIREMSNELTSCSTSSEKSPLKHLVEESNVPIERLTEEVFEDALKSVQESRKRHRQIIGSKHESKPIDSGFRKRENSSFTARKPCLMDQWHQVYPKTPPQIRVQPHEHSIVYRVVDATVEALCGRPDGLDAFDACETPSYLVDDKSRKGYRQVLFQLASDILHEVCANILETSSSGQKAKETSVISALQIGHVSVNYLKAAVRREAQKVLNLERTDQQMTEILQTLCKYWYAKRDQVDYVLIQELHSEESQWVDYSTDQITVKTRLAEEIFRLLLDDTISALNRIYISGNK